LIEWVDAIEVDPSTGFKRVAVQSSVNALAQIDPVRAARWIEGHLGRYYALRAPNVAARLWAERDPGAALSWLLSLPENSTEQDRTTRMFTRWLNRDAQSAESWLRSTVPSAAADPLVRVVIRRDFDRRPALAMEWAHLLHDPIVRTRVQTSAGRAWYRRNPESFKAWLPDSGLESQVQDLILNTPMRDERGGGDAPGRERTNATPGGTAR
jgi:hypothetical protein